MTNTAVTQPLVISSDQETEYSAPDNISMASITLPSTQLNFCLNLLYPFSIAALRHLERLNMYQNSPN